MVDPDRRPSAQEIEELIDLVRRDPGSPAFIDLGEAYLSLGRPRDAIQVGSLGLKANGQSMEGRVMVAKAHAALHQWKEAQGELLKVVKTDRNNRQGFALLGEVLLRRNDFDRALPVLQHAQNLDPTSPNVLTMLRRARAGEALDPPNPLPTPMAPRGATDEPYQIQRSRNQVPQASPGMPTMAIQPQPYSGLDGLVGGMPPGGQGYGTPNGYGAPSQAMAAPQPRMTKATAPPPMSVEGIKPRVIATAKPQNAAAASLRQSAAVGENYLNDLLAGGLLDVAGVRVPDQEFNLRPDRRLSRSTRRGILFLFVVLVIGVGGGGTWYWWHNKQQANELRAGNQVALGNAEYAGMTENLGKLLKTRESNPDDKQTYSNFVYVGGVASLLYGEVTVPSKTEGGKDTPVGPSQVDAAAAILTDGEDTGPTQPWWREYVIGNLANEIAKLPTDNKKVRDATIRLDGAIKLLDDWLDKHKDDKWAQWVKARSLLALGQRRTAMGMLKTLAEAKLEPGVFSPVIAQIDFAHLLTDEGKSKDALAMYQTAATTNKESHGAKPGEKVDEHPLVVLGEALAKAEASIEVNETIGDLNAKFADKIPPRMAAYRQLGIAVASLAIEDYPAATEALAKATDGKLGKPPNEPRFWSRIAWVHYKIGRAGDEAAKEPDDLAEAQAAYDKCIYFGKTPEADPTMTLVDAGLLLSRGLPDKVLDAATKIEGVRPRLLRTYALLDLGKAKEAYDEVTPVFKNLADANGKICEEANEAANFEARILCEQARMLAATDDKERTAAGNVLLDLARAAKSKLGRHALGVASLQVGNLVDAKEHLGQAVKDISALSPNPLEYRTRTALAEVALLEGDLATAEKQARLAVKIDPNYLPAKAELARVLVRSKPDEAEALLKPVLAEATAANLPMVQLAQAEVLAMKKDSKSRDKAEELIKGLQDKPGIRAEELSRIALLIDSHLPEKLGLPVPGAKSGDPKPPTPAPVQPPKRRPGRR